MSNEVSRDLDVPNEDETPEETPRAPRRGGVGFLAGLALILSLVALALATYREWRAFNAPEASWAGMAELEGLTAQVRADRAEIDALAERLASLPSPEAGVSEARVDRLDADLAALRASQADLRTLNDSLQFAVDALQARVVAAERALEGAATRSPAAPAGATPLDEAQEFLRLAGERLQVFGDVAGADEMLLLADERLAALDDPRMMPVRRAIAESRADLADVPVPDVARLESRIEALQGAVPGLPFPDDGPAPAVQEEAAGGWWARLKASLSGLVTVRRETDASDVPLALEDRDYVRQGLWLQLETARLALMRRDAATWQRALGRADESVATWFADSVAAARMREEIAALGGVEIAPALPDIGEARARLEIIAARRPVPRVSTEPGQAPGGGETAVESAPVESTPRLPSDDAPAGDAPADDPSGEEAPPDDEPPAEGDATG